MPDAVADAYWGRKRLSNVGEAQERVYLGEQARSHGFLECRAKRTRTCVNNAVGGPERGDEEVALNRKLGRNVDVVQNFLNALRMYYVRQQE